MPWGHPWAMTLTVALYLLGAARLLSNTEELSLGPKGDILLATAFVTVLILAVATPGVFPSVIALGGLVSGLVWNFQSPSLFALGFVVGIGIALVMKFVGLIQGGEFDLLTGGEWTRAEGIRGLLKVLVLLLVVWGWQWTARNLRERRLELSEARHAADRAADAERTAIARELHDVVAHHVSVMTLHAEGASAKASGPPKQAMLQVAESGRAALSELRRVLGLLRHGSEPAETGPQPGLGDLEELVARTTAAGLEVNLQHEGTRRKLEPGEELCVYRVAQEALTNVTRHSETSTIDLTLHWEPEAVRVVVGDPGPSRRSASSGTGLGLAGMRERVELRGGTLVAEKHRDGFVVDARIPTSRAPLTVAG